MDLENLGIHFLQSNHARHTNQVHTPMVSTSVNVHVKRRTHTHKQQTCLCAQIL